MCLLCAIFQGAASIKNIFFIRIYIYIYMYILLVVAFRHLSADFKKQSGSLMQKETPGIVWEGKTKIPAQHASVR
jgi:hypothetical protein